jgi:ParB-like chromosome segregation protein Spo0J
MISQDEAQRIEIWPIERLVEYPRNPRKNDGVVDRMCGSIREFGFKIPCLVRSDGEVVDGHLRLKAARKLGITEIPVILCDEWTPAQVKAFRLMVNRSVAWADWDEELLVLELQEIQESDFDLSLTGRKRSDQERSSRLGARLCALLVGRGRAHCGLVFRSGAHLRLQEQSVPVAEALGWTGVSR